jgi:TonB family protein
MVVDSAALMAFIRAIPVESADVTLSIVFRGDGAVPQTAVREGRELAEVADRVLRGVDSLLLAPPRSGSPWGIRFIVTPGKPGRLQVARAEYCPPVAEVAELRSETRTVQVSAADVARMEAEAREFQRRWQQMQEYVGRAWVSAAGRVMAVELVRSSGDVAADREAERMVRRSRFAAARIDGIAVYGWWTGNPVPRLPVE